MLERIPEMIAGIEGPRVITVFLAECIDTRQRHPMVRQDHARRRLGRPARHPPSSTTSLTRQAAVERAAARRWRWTRARPPAGPARARALDRAHHVRSCLFAPPPGDLSRRSTPSCSRSSYPRPERDDRTPPPYNPKEHHRVDVVIRGGHHRRRHRRRRVHRRRRHPTATASSRSARSTGRGSREIDADGAIVTPGFLDLHTHYDGQVTWDDALEPSATNGITTIVLGNCGVGLRARAPGRPRVSSST